jgi:amino acid adenylation domain-containing protein
MKMPTEYSTVRTGVGRLDDAVATWAKRNGDITAVFAADGELRFGDLAIWVQAIAGQLTANGVGRQTPVALFLGRSRLGLPALLAVWQLGATAVLVDDRHPADRLNFVLRDAGAQVLLADRVPPGVAPRGARIIRPDLAGAPAADPATAGPATPVPDPDDCAYVIYTSGTTGWPKGVEITYQNLATFLDALAGVGLSSDGAGINAVSPAFDGWLWCALLYLLHGQGMAIVDVAAPGGSGNLSELIAEHAPRTLCLTPTLLSALEEIPPADVIVVAGEPCPASLLARLAGTPRVLNVYGPTETTIAATWADSARGDDPVTIGRPLPGYLAYVLDGEGKPVTAGAQGELHVGGSAVARGYRNRPELTTSQFVPDPFAGLGSRMYRSGDLVRARPDGQLEFVGRVDGQVKVRGFRVELGEIEQAAMAVEPVRAAAAFPTSAGDSVGLAITVPPGADVADCVARIRAQCSGRLPDFMIPSVVSVVDVLPTLPTGKVDRTELARTAGAAAAGGRPPGTDRERQVCEVWGELLPRPVHDIEQSFFDLGGHSLLAARAVSILRRSTGLPLSVRHMLVNPTAQALAKELDLLAESGAEQK